MRSWSRALPFALALTLVALVSGHVHAAPSDASAKAQRAANLQGEALAALAGGHLETARSRALAALALDATLVTLPAQQVIFEVALTRGELSGAATTLAQVEGLPGLREMDRPWLARARLRLTVERAEGWADMGEARQALAELAALGVPPPIEQAWLERLTWRLSVRAPEQARDLGALREALDISRARALTDEDERWLEAAGMRADVLTAEGACRIKDAQATLARLQGVKDLREADSRWAQLVSLRLDLRALDATGRTAVARERLDQMATLPGLPVSERTWIEAYRVRLDLEEALGAGDRDAAARLRPAYEEWAAWEPACAQLNPVRVSRGARQPAAAGPTLTLAVTTGGTGWRARGPALAQGQGLLVRGSVQAWSIGAMASGSQPLPADLVLRGDLRFAPAVGATHVASGAVAGASSALDGALRLGWGRASWAIYAGAGLTRLRLSAVDGLAPVGGWGVEVLPQVAGAWGGPVGPGALDVGLVVGALPTTWSLSATGGYELGQESWRPRIGLDGRVAGGVNTARLSGVGDVDGAPTVTSLAFDQRDWSLGLFLGLAWGSAW